MNAGTWKDAEIRIAAVTLEGALVTFERELSHARAKDLTPLRAYEAAGEFEMSADAFARIHEMLWPMPRGASITTLFRRALYGGRKGRRALRRLRAAGYDLVVERATKP